MPKNDKYSTKKASSRIWKNGTLSIHKTQFCDNWLVKGEPHHTHHSPQYGDKGGNPEKYDQKL